MPGKCTYNVAWESDKQYSNWVSKCKNDNSKAFCKLCLKSFDISNMGIAALKSHSTSSRHKKAEKNAQQQIGKTPPISVFMPSATVEAQGNTAAAKETSIPNSSTSATPSRIDKYLVQEQAMKAEILWAFETVMSHSSFNSNKNKPRLFQTMFPDSDVAKQYQMKASKCKYLITYGIAPYVEQKLLEEVKKAEVYAAIFDESLNTAMQAKQMDVLVRFWSECDGQVKTRYLGSAFMGRATADDLVNNFESTLSKLGMLNLVQVSMDGPNVNWSFYDKLSERRKDEQLNTLVGTGSCSLHSVHGALQTGVQAADWEVAPFLCGIFILFHDSPGRRSEYIRITGSSGFPLHFCATRWMEDLVVVEIALQLLPNITVYVNAVLRKPPSQVPKTVTFRAVRDSCLDKLVVCKLKFFAFVAQQLKPFLTKFQSPEPLLPFLASELEALIRNIMSRCIKPEIVESCNTLTKLAKFDTKNEQNHLSLKKIDIGFETRRALSEVMDTDSISQRQKAEFLLDCQRFLLAVLAKLIERCPLGYPIVRHAVSLDPVHMVKNEEESIQSFSNLLQVLQKANWKTSLQCDSILLQYEKFVSVAKKECWQEFKSYACATTRLDEFLLSYFDKDQDELKKVFILVLTLSHGQSDVERGFSVSTEMEVENLKEDNLVALKMVFSELQSTPDFVDYSITAGLLQNCKVARQRYHQHLDDERKKVADTDKERKRKAIQLDLKDVKAKKLKLTESMERMQQEATDLAKQAEVKNDFHLLRKSNALREKAVGMSKELQTLNDQQERLTEDLKNQ